jgi:hypothetical protein
MKLIKKYIVRFKARNVFDIETMQDVYLVDYYIFNGFFVITRDMPQWLENELRTRQLLTN